MSAPCKVHRPLDLANGARKRACRRARKRYPLAGGRSPAKSIGSAAIARSFSKPRSIVRYARGRAGDRGRTARRKPSFNPSFADRIPIATGESRRFEPGDLRPIGRYPTPYESRFSPADLEYPLVVKFPPGTETTFRQRARAIAFQAKDGRSAGAVGVADDETRR